MNSFIDLGHQINSRVYTESAEQIKSPVNFKADSVSTGLLRISLLWSALVKGDESSPQRESGLLCSPLLAHGRGRGQCCERAKEDNRKKLCEQRLHIACSLKMKAYICLLFQPK